MGVRKAGGRTGGHCVTAGNLLVQIPRATVKTRIIAAARKRLFIYAQEKNSLRRNKS